MSLFEILKHQLAPARPVEGKDYAPKSTQQPAKPPRYLCIHVAPVDVLAAQCLCHCTIRRDERRIRSQAQAFQQRNGVRRPPPGGNGHGYTGLLGGAKRKRSTAAHRL